MTNKEIVSAFFTESYQNHNYDFAMNHISSDYLDHSPASARSNYDAVGILKLVESMFSDMCIEILDLIEEGDLVSTRVLFMGNHTGVCMGIQPTGVRVEFEALENFRLKDGLIVESWGYWPDSYIEKALAQ